MAPTLRPRKAKSGSEPTARTSAKGKSGLVDQPAQFSGPVNLTGFAALPPELILEVVDYFLSVPIPSPHLNRPLDRSHLDRHHILRYLSQLCQSLRHLLLPYVWRSLEVCTVKTETLGTLRVSVPSLSGGRYSPWEKEIATELVNQLEIVTIRNPDYADHVHTVSVIITKFSLKTVLPEFARCLGLLTNLKTLQLHGETWQVKRMVAQEFKKYRYPSIRTVVTTPGNLGVLSACPNLRHLHSTLSPGMMWIPVPCSQSIEKLTGKYGFGYDRESWHLCVRWLSPESLD
ncbi:hypothetical protein BDN72DRAFT_222981 [Pluteus cervinus]|uniref:Uncharacterized protein n=1 Tax=Pluteus cervinus TaxID=181527 RepID=A0ACD3BEU9_9AGAR|nr:hypothetical protein BDN72DRAFT_222981 [Pluteus cervinus]